MLRRTRHQIAIAIPICSILLATGIVYWITSRPVDDNELPAAIGVAQQQQDASTNKHTTDNVNSGLATTYVTKNSQDSTVGSN